MIVIDQVPRATQTWDAALEMLRAAVVLTDGQRAAAVVLANESRTDRSGRRAFQEAGQELLSCVALVVRSRVSEVTGNFFLRIHSPRYPMSMFKDADEACAWAVDYVGEPLGPGAERYLS